MANHAELFWDGKYDERGNRRAPFKIALPFQSVETINESTLNRQRLLFAQEREWRNRLIWGDKKYVLPSLLAEFAGKVDLIYIDPPFDTGENFAFTAHVPSAPGIDAEELEFVKQPSIIELKAYRDTWGKGIDSYLQWLYETFILLRELLSERGSIFVHIDVHQGPYAKVLLDEVFGRENFQNEIIWYYYNKLHDSRKRVLPKAFDQVLYYVKSKALNQYTYNPLKEPRETPVTKLKYKKVKGRIQNIIGDDGKAVTYTSEDRTLDNVWRIRCLQPANKAEWVNFETQKPVDFIERILQLASNPDDLVLDCFCGSGTTLVAATRQNRRWIGCDLGRFAIHTTRKRLLAEPSTTPFVIENLGRYERQLWRSAAFGKEEGGSRRQSSKAAEIQKQYLSFIVKLYSASLLSGHAWIHGIKSGRLIHVGSVDAPVTAADVTQIVIEAKKIMGSGAGAPARAAIDVLGWDFAFDVNEVVQQQAAKSKIALRFIRIPREVMEKQAVAQGDIRFFELGALSVTHKIKRRDATIALDSFVIPPDEVPADVQQSISHWSQWIDYWAIDWDNKSDTFHNEWQSFRTRTATDLQLSATHRYEGPGAYRVLVKVIDILGNDTTKSLMLEVG